MATSIFSLFGEIFVDNEKANKNIDETTKKGSNLGTTLSKGFATVGKVAAGVGAAAGAAGAAIYGLANNAAEATDRIDKGAQKLGMSREGFQEWDFILSQNGASVDSLGTVMKKLGGVIDGTSKAGVAAFQRLGISAEGMNNEEAFAAAVAALQGIEDESEKASIANELFGKSYQDLMPLLNSTAEATEGLKDQAHELGLVMNDDAIDSGVQLHDTLDSVQRSFSAIITQLGSSLIPVVQQVADFILASMPAVMAIFEQLAPLLIGLGDAIAPLLMQLASEVLPVILDLIMQLMPFLTEVIEQVLPIVFDILGSLLPVVTQIISQLLPVLLSIMGSLMPIVQNVLGMLSPILELVMLLLNPLLQLINLILPPLSNLLGGIGTLLTGMLSDAIQWVVDKFNGFKQTLDKVREWLGSFKDNWEKVWGSVSDFFKGIWDGIKEFFKAPLNWIISKLNDFIRWVNKIQIPDWVPIVGGKGFHLNEIPMLAEGGVIRQPGTAIVGERGPELVHLDRGAVVDPLKKTGGLTLNVTGATVMRPSDIEWLVDLLIELLHEKGVV